MKKQVLDQPGSFIYYGKNSYIIIFKFLYYYIQKNQELYGKKTYINSFL